MEFLKWLEQFIESEGHLGFLARFVKQDKDFPAVHRLLDLERQIASHVKYDGLLPAFTAAWKAFETSMEKPGVPDEVNHTAPAVAPVEVKTEDSKTKKSE